MKWENPFLKWAVWFILFFAFLLSAIFMMGNAGERLALLCQGMQPPDLVLLLNKQYFMDFFEACGSKGVHYYREIAVLQDIIYPFSYASFLAISINNFFLARKRQDYRVLNKILLFPLAALLADIFENMMFLKLSYEFPDLKNTTYYFSRFFHAVKWISAAISMGVLFYLLFDWFRYVIIRKKMQ
jgi:hypothetical protein